MLLCCDNVSACKYHNYFLSVNYYSSMRYAYGICVSAIVTNQLNYIFKVIKHYTLKHLYYSSCMHVYYAKAI